MTNEELEIQALDDIVVTVHEFSKDPSFEIMLSPERFMLVQQIPNLTDEMEMVKGFTAASDAITLLLGKPSLDYILLKTDYLIYAVENVDTPLIQLGIKSIRGMLDQPLEWEQCKLLFGASFFFDYPPWIRYCNDKRAMLK